MDEENRGPHVKQRRISSILKLPLAGIDPNTQIKEQEIEKKRRRSSKRVSFSETLGVREFKKSQCVNSDTNVFLNDDKEIAGIDSLLTGKIIKNPAIVLENISDPEDNSCDGTAAMLNCSVYQSEKMDIIQNSSSNVKANISFASSPNRLSPADVGPADQSMYCSPEFDATPLKLDNKLFFKQLIEKFKTSSDLSPDNSPVVTVACRPSMSTKMFCENLLQDPKFNKSSFSPDLLFPKETFPDDVEMNIGASPVLDKSHCHNESSEPVDETIHFNFNPNQTAGMDFTMCNSKVFSDSFNLENFGDPQNESPLNVTRCFTNADDTNANMELTVCTGHLMAPSSSCVPKETFTPQNTASPKSDEITVYFGSDNMPDADMELTKCHDKLLSGRSRIEYKYGDGMKQKLTTCEDPTKIFNQAEDTIADKKMKLGMAKSSSSFLDRSSKAQCEIVRKENEIETNETNHESKSHDASLMTNMELTSSVPTKLEMYPTCTKNVPNEDDKENIVPSMLSRHADEMQIEEINILGRNQKDTQRMQGNLDDDKQSVIKGGAVGLTERPISCVSFLDLSANETNTISDVVNAGSTKPVKKTLKRVSFKCPEEESRNESCLLDEDDPPMKKLCSGNQVDPHGQQSGSTDVQHEVSMKTQCENNASFTDGIAKKKSGGKRVSFYEPEEVRNITSEESFSQKILAENVANTSEKKTDFFLADDRPSEKEDVRSTADLQSTTHTEETNKCLYISANTSGIIKSFVNHDDCSGDETVNKDLIKKEKKMPVASANDQLLENNTLDRTSVDAEPQPEKSSESNKYLYISLNNSGSIKSFSLDEKPLDDQQVDENLNRSVKMNDVSPKPCGVDEARLQTCGGAVSTKTIIGKPEPISLHCDREPLDNRLEKSISHAKKTMFPDHVIGEDSSQKEKETIAQVADKVNLSTVRPVGNQLDLADDRLEKSISHAKKTMFPDHVSREDSSQKEKETIAQVADKVNLSTVRPVGNQLDLADDRLEKSISHAKKIMFSDHVCEDLSQKEKETIAQVADEVNPVGNQLDLADIPKHERLPKAPNFRTSWQGMFSIDNVIKNIKQTHSGSIPVTSCADPTRTSSMSAVNIMQHKASLLKNSKQPFLKVPSQDEVSDANHDTNESAAKIPSPSKARKYESNKPANNSSVNNDFQFEEDSSGIMSENCDILIDVSRCEDTAAHVSRSQTTSMLHSSRQSFRNKSLDTLSNTLCSRMLINVHSASRANKLSAFEAESLEELLLFIGISKVDNFTIDDRVHFSSPEFEVMTLKKKLIRSFLEAPKYQTLLKTYEALKADEDKLLKEYNSKKLLKDFQISLKQKEDHKSTDELKNELIDDLKKTRQLSHQKIKQRKNEHYGNLYTVLKDKLVILEEAKSQVDVYSQTLDQQIGSLDGDLSALDKELDYLQSLPELTDEDCYQYTQVAEYIEVVHKVELKEEKLSNTCCQLMEQEKSLKEKYSSLEEYHANLLKTLPLDTAALLKNCQKLKIYSVLFPWKLWQIKDNRQKYNFWIDTFQLCIHTRAESVEKAHFQLDENWQSVVADEPWLEIAHEMRLNEMEEKSFLDLFQNTSQLPTLLKRLGTLLSSFQDLAMEIHAVSLKKVVKRQKNSILVTYCSAAHLSKVKVRFEFDPINYPTDIISHEVDLIYGNVRCQDISRKLRKVKPGALYLSRLVNAVQLESVSTSW